MNKVYATIVVALLSIAGFAQAPGWLWATNSAGGNANDESVAVALDAAGNEFVCGPYYSPTITFGSTVLTNSDNSGASPDIFVVKYSPAGTVLWAKSLGGALEESAGSIATDASGNVFVCGYFRSNTIVFGSSTISNTANGYDYYLAKYDSNGNPLWAVAEGGTGYEDANGVATDAAGNAYITGTYTSAAFSIGSTSLSNGGSDDIFVAKYDGSGNAVWASCANGLHSDIANAITVDPSGNVFVTGMFRSSSFVFGSITINNTGSTTTTDIFIAKLNSTGTFVWAKKAGGTSSDVSYSITTDAAGNVYTAGYFNSSSFTFGSFTLTNGGGSDMLLLKFDNSGNELLAISEGGTGYEIANCVRLDALGSIYLAGSFQLADFIVGSDTLFAQGGTDAFLLKYNAAGVPVWATSVGDDYNDWASGVAIDGIGNIYVTGAFGSPQLFFGTIFLPNTSNMATNDMFLAKMNGASVGTPETENSSDAFTVFPNPFSSQTTITFREEQENTSVIVLNALGQEVKTMNCNGMQCIIDKGTLVSGIYFLQVTDRYNKVQTRKIIVQ